MAQLSMQSLMNERKKMKSWLQANNLNLLPVLIANNINNLDDLAALETEADIDELAQELKMKVVIRNKFKKAMLGLISMKEGNGLLVHFIFGKTHCQTFDLITNHRLSEQRSRSISTRHQCGAI